MANREGRKGRTMSRWITIEAAELAVKALEAENARLKAEVERMTKDEEQFINLQNELEWQKALNQLLAKKADEVRQMAVMALARDKAKYKQLLEEAGYKYDPDADNFVKLSDRYLAKKVNRLQDRLKHKNAELMGSRNELKIVSQNLVDTCKYISELEKKLENIKGFIDEQ